MLVMSRELQFMTQAARGWYGACVECRDCGETLLGGDDRIYRLGKDILPPKNKRVNVLCCESCLEERKKLYEANEPAPEVGFRLPERRRPKPVPVDFDSPKLRPRRKRTPVTQIDQYPLRLSTPPERKLLPRLVEPNADIRSA